MKKIVIDPITRIEGHLRIEAVLDENNTVREAFASGQLFRGIEIILKGRDPRDAPLLAQRICGVCTNVHYRCSVSAIEDAYGIAIPKNALLIRDLISLTLFLQDHVVHFYHLHLLDFVDVTKTADADIKKAESLAYRYSDNPYRNSEAHLLGVRQKIADFLKAGRLGPFAHGYWGHGAYRLSPEANLLLISHYLEALRFQRDISRAIAIFAGKVPHPQNLVVGGITSIMDMLSPQRLNDFLFLLKEARDFIQRAYLPDAMLLSDYYQEEMRQGVGRGAGNFLCAGGYTLGGRGLFDAGVVFGHDFDAIKPFDESKITEEVERSWYEPGSASPFDEQTKPFYTDLNSDKTLKTQERYSWIKAPRYEGQAVETGPLARMLIGYHAGNPLIRPAVERFLKELDLNPIDLCSAVGRNAARAIESGIIADLLFDFMNELVENIKYYDEESCTPVDYESLPSQAKGRAFFEVPRGMLSHFVSIKDRKIENYQVIAPTTWNASPKDAEGQSGPYEEALRETKLQDPQRPLEILRIVHSFDPCLACAVHIIDTRGKQLGEYKIQAGCPI